MDFRLLQIWDEEAGICIVDDKLGALENARMAFHASSEDFQGMVRELVEVRSTIDSVQSREEHIESNTEAIQNLLNGEL